MYALWAEGHFCDDQLCKPLMLEVAKSILSDMMCRQQRLRMVVPLGMVATRYGCPRIWLPPIWLPPDMVTTVAIDPHQESGC